MKKALLLVAHLAAGLAILLLLACVMTLAIVGVAVMANLLGWRG